MATHFSKWGEVAGVRYVVRLALAQPGAHYPEYRTEQVLQQKWQRTSFDPDTHLNGIEEEWRDIPVIPAP